MTSLIDLINSVDETLDFAPGDATLHVTQLTADSRQVRAGALFVALPGEKADGARFILQAKQSGAVAVLCDWNADVKSAGLPVVRAKNPRRALALMAAAFYHRQPKHMVAVTGTDGKSSTADFFRQLMHGLGEHSASIGTIGILSGAGEELYPGSHTTPDPVALMKLLSDLSSRGVNYACMEASSHGLHQHRLDGVKLEAAAFTNLTRDHMDYHHTEEAYFEAKARLFSQLLPEGKTAALNQDDSRFGTLANICKKRGHKIIGFGHNGEQFKILDREPAPHGQEVALEIHGHHVDVEVPLVGAFQVMNILAALGLVSGVGGDVQQALALIPELKGVPGRLEQVARLRNGASIFIDYAHTPAALANILKTVRPHTKKSLHVVFGCGGDRDMGKRPEMGKAAEQLADVVIITDDNPRSEEPALIRRAIMAACPKGKEVPDRREAIYAAVRGLKSGDVLVIAGKGHEKTQIIGDKTYPFDDAVVARLAVKELAA